MNERESLILLNQATGLSAAGFRRLLEAFGSAAAILAAPPAQLRQVEGITSVVGQEILRLQATRSLGEEEAQCRKEGVAILTLCDASYPVRLKAIHDPPPVLYIKGRLEAEEPAVAIVGSRRASLYGLRMARRFGRALAERGATVVSGLARGIDSAAHQGALEEGGGRTIAVLGSGLSRLYPPEHRPLAEAIAKQGAVLSEFPLTTPPAPYHFPRRNRIISGLSLGVIVVEASERSGALITVDCALEQGREVFAVPGQADAPTARGIHRLLKQGAKLVTDVDDVLEELRLRPLVATPPPPLGDHPAPHPVLAGLEAAVYEALGQEPQAVDAIASMVGQPPAVLAGPLVHLELKHLIHRLPGARFVREVP